MCQFLSMIHFIAVCCIVLGILVPNMYRGLADEMEISDVRVQEVNNTEVVVEDEVLEDKTEESESGGGVYCSCVKTARHLGADIPLGTDAEDLLPNTKPTTGTVMLLKYPLAYHVAVVKEITEDGYVIVEGNMVHCEFQERVVPLDYKAIRGFWEPQS